MEWQPIETAPKDGTPILCVRGHCQPVVAWFETFPEPLLDGDQTKWRWREAGDFVSDNSWREDWHGTLYEPTHWMPLPAPPSLPPNEGG